MYVADTNIVSELTRKRPDANVLAWFETQASITVSAITVEELAFGVARVPAAKRASLEAWFEALLASGLTVLPVDAGVAKLAGQWRAARASKGRPLEQADALIAATVKLAGRTLVTRNVDDFAGLGVPLLNPFGA